MNPRLRLAAWCAAIALPAAAAPDEWELLPAPPFPFGVSSGGGLATDGTFLYAADFSGDADHDFVDLDDDHACGPGELLGDLGIANASVRVARYDPRTNAWEALPGIDTAWGGDSFSAGNLNRPLFCAGGSLYYYQFRAGPQRCVLHRYDLAAAPGGAWQQLWDKDADAALITANAGIVGADSPAGPVILHHRGGGAYEFCRTSALASGGLHVTLTPDWPFDAAHFPRNGGWEFDPNSGHLYHMSGNQLLRWSPSPAYPDASFLTAEPVPGPPLAAFAAATTSLRAALGWNPGGSAPNPGASLWGNSITVVNDPSGVAGGPAGEDTGAGAVYLVRGETSADGWPFNEGRGLVSNGDFARWFPATNAFQSLPRAPFDVGKGSAAAYHDGHLYLTQGDTRSSPDATGNDAPLNTDGIRRPGNGFARFRIRAATYTTGHPVIPIASLLHAGFATATTSPLAAGTAADMLDGDRATSGTTAGANPALVTITFPGAKSVGAARGVFAAEAHHWTLDAADSEADLAAGSGTFVRVFGPQAVGGEGPHWQQWNEAPVIRRVFRFTVARDAGGPVEIRELELQYAKQIHTLEVGGRQVQVNHLEILPASLIIRAGQPAQLAAELSLSLGPERHDATAEAAWASSNPTVANVSAGAVAALATGQATVTATCGPLTALAPVTVVDPQPHDDDMSVAWIQRLPVLDYTWDSPQPHIDGWPAAGSTVTWRARIRNWSPFPRADVACRWLLDGEVAATASVDLAPNALTDVDLPWTWSFDRHALAFELDPAGTIAEASEDNNRLSTWTDAISVAFWVEQSVSDYFHRHQHELGAGSNGWDDWAQRQVARWNAAFAAAAHPLDAPAGVRDRIRLDKVTVVPDGALPLAGGLPTNNPDNNDRTTDLVWGFPASLLDGSMYSDHTTVADTNPFWHEGSLIHELGHARYLVDVYGFNVCDRDDNRSVLITHAGGFIADTPWMPRTWPWWDHVFYVAGWGEGGPFHGLMNSHYTTIDRYSTMALNLIAGHRATRGNCNAPGNIGAFLNDLPEQNTVQLVDGHGQPLAGAVARVYQAGPADGWYAKAFDDVPDATFTADARGCIEVGRNPFTGGGPITHGYGASTVIAIVRVDAGPNTGFAFLPSALFNMEAWRGHAAHGRHELVVPMLGAGPDIAHLLAWPEPGGTRRLRIVCGGATQPQSVAVDGVAATFQHGAWWVSVPAAPSAPSQVTATWPGGTTLSRPCLPGDPPPAPTLTPQAAHDGPRAGWWSRAGHVYHLQASQNLLEWEPAPGTNHWPGTGGWLETALPGAPGRGFARLQVFRLAD